MSTITVDVMVRIDLAEAARLLNAEQLSALMDGIAKVLNADALGRGEGKP